MCAYLFWLFGISLKIPEWCPFAVTVEVRDDDNTTTGCSHFLLLLLMLLLSTPAACMNEPLNYINAVSLAMLHRCVFLLLLSAVAVAVLDGFYSLKPYPGLYHLQN